MNVPRGRKVFGNREFFINAMNYLLDDKSRVRSVFVPSGFIN